MAEEVTTDTARAGGGGEPTVLPPRRVFVVGFVDALALGVYLALVPVFLSRTVALGDARTGIVLAVAGVTSIAGALPIGRFADRVGSRRALVVLFALRAACFLGLATIDSFVGALVAAGIAGLLNRGVNPVIQSVALGPNRGDGPPAPASVRALAWLRALRNAGIGGGAIPAAIAVGLGSTAAFRFVLAGVAVLVVACLPLVAGLPPGRPTAKPPPRLAALRDRRFAAITAAYALLSLPALVLTVGLPLWIVQATRAPSWSIGAIQVINTVLVVALQVVVSRGSERFTRARRLVWVGGLLAALATAMIPVLAAPAPPAVVVILLVGLVVLFTVAEIFTTSGTMAVALSRLPPGPSAGPLATFNLGFGLATVLGPPLATEAAAVGTPGWMTLALLLVIVAAACTRLKAPATHAP